MEEKEIVTVRKGLKKPKKSNLKIILETRQLQQKHLAQLTDLETCQVSLLVKGDKNGKRSNLHMSTAVKICRVLRCSLDEAFGDLINQLEVD